jgi:hypothetical protein
VLEREHIRCNEDALWGHEKTRFARSMYSVCLCLHLGRGLADDVDLTWKEMGFRGRDENHVSIFAAGLDC